MVKYYNETAERTTARNVLPVAATKAGDDSAPSGVLEAQFVVPVLVLPPPRRQIFRVIFADKVGKESKHAFPSDS
jgi:hypothetical protein